VHSVLSAEASGCLQCKRHDGSAVDDIVSEPSAIEEFSARASEATEELSAPASEAWAHLRGPHSRLGTRLSAVDYKGTAYGATVIAVQYCQAQCNRVKVSFDGWGEAFDEWIPADSDRLFPEGSLDLVEAGVEGQLQGKQQLSTAQAANTAGPYPWIDAPGKAIGDGAEESGSGEGGDNLLEARICRELGRGWVRIKRVCTAKTRPYWIAPDGSRFQKHMLAKEYAGVTDTEAPARTVTEEDLGPPVQPMLTSDVGSVQGSNMDPEAPDPGSALDECIIPDPKAVLDLFRHSLAVGSRLRASDWQGTVYNATVVGVLNTKKKGRVKVRFDGWSMEFDEWIPRASNRLHPLPRGDEAGTDGATAQGGQAVVQQTVGQQTVGQLKTVQQTMGQQAPGWAAVEEPETTHADADAPKSPRIRGGVAAAAPPPKSPAIELGMKVDEQGTSQPGASEPAALKPAASNQVASATAAIRLTSRPPTEATPTSQLTPPVPTTESKARPAPESAAPRDDHDDSERETEAYEDDLDAIEARYFLQAKAEGLTLIPWCNATGWKGGASHSFLHVS
jgi:hypothetical protein